MENVIKMKKRVKAFTLAEVLITLSILGVVAAISIPNIIQQYQKRLIITKLQKAYANLEIAAQNIALNSGCIGRDIACTKLADVSENTNITESFMQLSGFKNYKKNSQRKWICPLPDYYTNSEHCKADSIQNSYIVNDIGYYVSALRNTILPNLVGNSLLVNVYINNKKNYFYKGINLFTFIIYDNFVVEPVSECSGTQYCPASKTSNSRIDKYCSKDVTGLDSGYRTAGWSCAAKIIKDGWKITYQ